jgi:hypothetical protein
VRARAINLFGALNGCRGSRLENRALGVFGGYTPFFLSGQKDLIKRRLVNFGDVKWQA